MLPYHISNFFYISRHKAVASAWQDAFELHNLVTILCFLKLPHEKRTNPRTNLNENQLSSSWFKERNKCFYWIITEQLLGDSEENDCQMIKKRAEKQHCYRPTHSKRSKLPSWAFCHGKLKHKELGHELYIPFLK